MLSGYELLLSYCHPTCLRVPFSPSPPLIAFKMIHTASKSPKKDQRYYAKRGNKQNKKTHIALFCDGNFKQFRKPELCSEGLSYPLWVSGVLPCVDWVLTFLAFLMRPRSLVQTIISDCNHKENVPPSSPVMERELLNFPYPIKKGSNKTAKVRMCFLKHSTDHATTYTQEGPSIPSPIKSKLCNPAFKAFQS